MRGDNLKRHIMDNFHGNVIRHEQENEDNVATKGQKISFTSKNSIAVEKRVFADLEEFNRKMEIGQKVKLLVDKLSSARISLRSGKFKAKFL